MMAQHAHHYAQLLVMLKKNLVRQVSMQTGARSKTRACQLMESLEQMVRLAPDVVQLSVSLIRCIVLKDLMRTNVTCPRLVCPWKDNLEKTAIHAHQYVHLFAPQQRSIVL